MLSVTAKPFHPVHGMEMDTVICNDGIPACYIQESESEFLHSISDEAIDEAFPPSAEEAAELEAVEIFVEMMATLAHLEEREEVTRFSEDHKGLGKRWVARRELQNKPRPAKHTVEKVLHVKRPTIEKATELVPFDIEKSHAVLKEHRMRQREIERMARMTTPHLSKKETNRHRHQMPIQQPRKQN
jgi:hypothetical protein